MRELYRPSASNIKAAVAYLEASMIENAAGSNRITKNVDRPVKRRKGRVPTALSPNRHSSVSWNLWDGAPWDLSSVSIRYAAAVRGMKQSEQAMKEAEQRLMTSYGHRLKLDQFLVRYQRALVRVHHKMLPIWEIFCESETIWGIIQNFILLYPHSSTKYHLDTWVIRAKDSMMSGTEPVRLKEIYLSAEVNFYDPVNAQYVISSMQLSQKHRDAIEKVAVKIRKLRQRVKIRTSYRGVTTKLLHEEGYGKLRLEKDQVLMALPPRATRMLDSNPKVWPAKALSLVFRMLHKRLIMDKQELRNTFKLFFFSNHLGPKQRSIRSRRLATWRTFALIESELDACLNELSSLVQDYAAICLFRAGSSSQQAMAREIEKSRVFYHYMSAKVSQETEERRLKRLISPVPTKKRQVICQSISPPNKSKFTSHHTLSRQFPHRNTEPRMDPNSCQDSPNSERKFKIGKNNSATNFDKP